MVFARPRRRRNPRLMAALRRTLHLVNVLACSGACVMLVSRDELAAAVLVFFVGCVTVASLDRVSA